MGDLFIGESEEFSFKNANGRRRQIRRNFSSAAPGDKVICYVPLPKKKVVALAEVESISDGQSITIRKVEQLISPVGIDKIRSNPELSNMEFFRIPPGTLFSLTEDEYFTIIGIIRASNPDKMVTAENQREILQKLSSLSDDERDNNIIVQEAILLVAIINLYERKAIFSRRIVPSSILSDEFKKVWWDYAPDENTISPEVAKAFYALGYSSFWTIVPKAEVPSEENLISFEDIIERYKYAELSEQMFSCLTSAHFRSLAKERIISQYLSNNHIKSDVDYDSIDDLYDRISKILKNEEIVGLYDFPEKDYSLMLEAIRGMSKDGLKKAYHKTFITLVEITKRWGSDNQDEDTGSFWNYVCRTIYGREDIAQTKRNIFIDCIKLVHDKFGVSMAEYGQKYYTTLMMHSLAPVASIEALFNLCFNVFRNDLEYSFTSEDRWICDIMALQLHNVFKSHATDNSLVSFGSSRYDIRIGLKCLAANPSLTPYLTRMIDGILLRINDLFNNSKPLSTNRIEKLLDTWWKTRAGLEIQQVDRSSHTRTKTVTKKEISAKYIREDNSAFLSIPPIRLDSSEEEVVYNVYLSDTLLWSNVMPVKQGEFVTTTKQLLLNIEDILENEYFINIRLVVKSSGSILYDSKNSLFREFILFDGEHEVLSQTNATGNYFIFTKDIDRLSIPKDVHSIGLFLHNIYPVGGESLVGQTKKVLFLDYDQTLTQSGVACLAGTIKDATIRKEEKDYSICTEILKLIIPSKFDLKALELRIDGCRYKLNDLPNDILEDDSHMFSLVKLGIVKCPGYKHVEVYSFDSSSFLIDEQVAFLPDFQVQFNRDIYYGDMERNLEVTCFDSVNLFSWGIDDTEISCPINDGELIVKPPYLRWRINGHEWQHEPIPRVLWYKEYLESYDLIDVDCPTFKSKIVLKIGDAETDICRYTSIEFNQNNQFEIGRIVYAIASTNHSAPIRCCIDINGNIFDLFTLATKEQFLSTPLSNVDGKLVWMPEGCYVGDADSRFRITAQCNGNKKIEIFEETLKSTILPLSGCGQFDISISRLSNNPFILDTNHADISLWNEKIMAGDPRAMRYLKKRLNINSVITYSLNTYPLRKKYVVDRLEYKETIDGIDYYSGRLCNFDEFNIKRPVDELDGCPINPVRIEFRDCASFWLVSNWEGGLNNHDECLFINKRRGDLCDIDREDEDYSEILLYKFVETNV